MTACPKTPRVVDKAYRKRAAHMPCRACGLPAGTGRVVLAHVRLGNAGMGLKPPDSDALYLCGICHRNFDLGDDRCKWLVVNILLPILRREFQAWREGTGR